MQYTLDNTKAKTFQMSNDAFHYLMYGEDPLDEDNLEEANEISAMFPFGFSIGYWEYVEDEDDLIEATFIPYVKDDIKYDGYKDFVTKNHVIKYKKLTHTTAQIRIENVKTGEIKLDCVCNIVQFNNKPWVVFNLDGDASSLSSYNSCCQIPLFKFINY